MGRKKKTRRYKCKCCEWTGDKPRTLWLGGIGFAVCPKCDGRTEETEEWLEEYRKKMDETWCNR